MFEQSTQKKYRRLQIAKLTNEPPRAIQRTIQCCDECTNEFRLYAAIRTATSARFVIDRSSIVHLDTMVDPVLLYHVTPSKFVDDIKKGVKLNLAKPRTDFRRENQAFYLTDNEDIAKTVMAEEVGGFANQPTAVITFSLDLNGLKVKTFSRELEGDTLDEWRAVWLNLRDGSHSTSTIAGFIRRRTSLFQLFLPPSRQTLTSSSDG